MKRIIALRGKGDSGKTTTIWLLPNILRTNGYTNVPGVFRDHGKDFSDIFENAHLRIGVTSAGDTFDLVHNRLQELIDNSCEVCICACRTFDKKTQGTNAAVNSFSPLYTVEFLEKTIEQNPAFRDAANNDDANRLFRSI